MLGVFGIIMQVRKGYFKVGTPLHQECQLSWLEQGDEEWTIVSVKESFSHIVVGLAQGTGMEIHVHPPFDLPVSGTAMHTIWRSEEVSQEAIEEENDQFLEFFKP